MAPARMSRERQAHRRAAVAAVAALGWWATLAVYVVHPAVPFNPVRLPHADRLRVQFFMPEGWGFFTRDPREPDLHLLVRDGARWAAVNRAPHGGAAALFGLRRVSRAWNIEAGLLIGNRSLPWRTCRGSDDDCLRSAAAPAAVQNPARRPLMCGPAAFIERESVPWAWAASVPPERMPARVVVLEVVCRSFS